ncbi:DUF2285 domain-containing protein [Rhizobium pusense]|nr:DUF2285 domain-containing protein [Agrobacterium pusense]MDH1270521.1 DUF2285 domain-containing protein [Agrobacterium pusense]
MDKDTMGRVEALIRFWQSLFGRRVARDTRMTPQQRRRFRHILQAVDGHMNGASYREIAEVVFGVDRIAAEHWKTSALRDATIDLVKDGHLLIDGGYRRLLRHRRRR